MIMLEKNIYNYIIKIFNNYIIKIFNNYISKKYKNNKINKDLEIEIEIEKLKKNTRIKEIQELKKYKN